MTECPAARCGGPFAPEQWAAIWIWLGGVFRGAMQCRLPNGTYRKFRHRTAFVR